MQCTSCGFENQVGMKFCTECGTRLANLCPGCNFENPPQAKFCGACGQALSTQVLASSQAVSDQAAAVTAGLKPAPPERQPAAGDRRQVTVMFCDLVGSTPLSEQLDPEEWRDVLGAYHATCTQVIDRFGGHIAKYLGDGLLVFFGYPAAHEDDAPRSLYAGLGILQELQQLSTRLNQPLAVRIGIHTGLVVAGEVGNAAMDIVGTTPHIAARLQTLARPGTLVVSADTCQLAPGLFTTVSLGPQTLRGVSEPIPVYRVVRANEARHPLEAPAQSGLTPLTGREKEAGLLLERWEQVQERRGQVILLSGEAGIGKSRLIQALAEQAAQTSSATLIEYRCSPYYQSSALYPLIDFLQRILNFKLDEMPHQKLDKLARALDRQGFPRDAVLPLFAALLSLPHPEGCPALVGTPQQQKQKMQETLVIWLLQEAERQPLHCVVEDLHWADPSSLEFISLLIDHIPRARMLLLLTYRPEFQPPWALRSHMTQMMLSRLPRKHIEVMIANVTKGKTLPAEVVEQIALKTDGVPLFVEELTKMVVESNFLREEAEGYTLIGPLPNLAIPTTLQDSLMARLDRLAPVREIAQLGATLGREFSFELIKVVCPLSEPELQQALAVLVEAEILYQRGILPNAEYTFKHALIQDAAYQSLLKSKRQHYHEQIARTLTAYVSVSGDIHPELLAHHYTQAGLTEEALPYWYQAGERAVGRSANEEAIRHLQTGLTLLDTLPPTPPRDRHELAFRTALGTAFMAVRGSAAPEVAQAYGRARELCEQIGDLGQLFTILRGFWVHHLVRGDLHRARELGEKLLALTAGTTDALFHAEARFALGGTFFWLGEPESARTHIGQGLRHTQRIDDAAAYMFGQHVEVGCLSYETLSLLVLGYPEQARQERNRSMVDYAKERAHPLTLVYAHFFEAAVSQLRHEANAVRTHARAMIQLSQEQGFPYWLSMGTILEGWARSVQGEVGEGTEGITQIQHGLREFRKTGAALAVSYFLGLLADACLQKNQGEGLDETLIEAGLTSLAEALSCSERTGERIYASELHRLKGELLFRKAAGRASHALAALPPGSVVQIEQCFQQALSIARRQRAKWFELRAAISLHRFWQEYAAEYPTAQQKRQAARRDLQQVHDWFTEGLDTDLLRKARGLLDHDAPTAASALREGT